MWFIRNGYQVSDLTAPQTDAPGALNALAASADPTTLRQAVHTALEHQGRAIKVKHKGQIVAVFVLSREQSANGALLRLTTRAVLNEHEAAIQALESSTDMTAELRNLLRAADASSAAWGTRTVEPAATRLGHRSAAGAALGMALGLAMGAAMHSIGVGLCFGAAFSGAMALVLSQKKGS